MGRQPKFFFCDFVGPEPSDTQSLRRWESNALARYKMDGPVVYTANALGSRPWGDQVPLGSSPTKSQKKKKINLAEKVSKQFCAFTSDSVINNAKTAVHCWLCKDLEVSNNPKMLLEQKSSQNFREPVRSREDSYRTEWCHVLEITFKERFLARAKAHTWCKMPRMCSGCLKRAANTPIRLYDCTHVRSFICWLNPQPIRITQLRRNTILQTALKDMCQVFQGILILSALKYIGNWPTLRQAWHREFNWWANT